jgi:secreted PhoX family phosphatase
MKLKALLFSSLVAGSLGLQAQIRFDPQIKVDHLTDTLMYPSAGTPLKYQILFKGGFDEVETTPTYGNPAGKAVSKSWNDFIGFTPDETGESLGWISVNHEQVVADDNLGDGGGMTVFRVTRDPQTDTLILVEQTLEDGRKGTYFNVDFVNTTGETGMNCGGIVSLADGRIWTAEEWFRYSNDDIADRDKSDFIIGQGTVDGQVSPAGFPGFNGAQIQKFENYNYMTEIDPRQAKAIRKQYNWGRQAFEGGVVLPDNKTVYLGVDNTPGFFSKFIADTEGDFTQGTTYVYRHDDSKLKLNHFSSELSTFGEISAYDDVNNRIYSTNSGDIGVSVFSLVDGIITKLTTIDLSSYGFAPNSVAVHNGILAVAMPATTKTDNGFILFYDKDYTLLNTVTVGALPDMVTFSPDGKFVIVANEGEPNDDYTIDPEGSISVIDISGGIASASVTNASFAGVTLPAGVRVFGQSKGSATDLFISEYAEGSSYNKYLEIYNGTGSTVNLEDYAFPNVGNDPTVAGEYEFWNDFPTGATIADGDVYIIADARADSLILAEADYTFNFLSNGDDGFALVKGGSWIDADTDGNKDAGEVTGFTILDLLGDWNARPSNGWDVAGQSAATQNQTLVRKGLYTGSADWTTSAGTTAGNSEWIVKPNDDWSGLAAHSLINYATQAQDMEPEYVAVSGDSKTAYVVCQENNAIAVVDLATASITNVFALGTKDLSNPDYALDASDKDDSIGYFRNYDNVYSYFMPDAIAITEIGGTEYLVSANEGDSRDYDGFSEEVRVKDLDLDPTAFPNAAVLQLDENLGRMKVTTMAGDTDGDGDYDEIYGYGGRSFSIWDLDGNLVFDSKNEITRILAEQFPDNYPASRDDDKGAEPESVTIGKIGSRTFAFIGLERATGVMVYDITDPANSTFVQYYNKDVNDRSPEGLIFVSADKSTDGKPYLISTNEAFDEYEGSVSAYSISGLDGETWVEINNTDINKMLHYQDEAIAVGATMFNRLEWVTYDTETKAVYMTETGRDNPGGRWAAANAAGGAHAEHNLARAEEQGVDVNSAAYWDYYGRVLKYDVATEDVTVQIEGGPYLASSPTQSNYPENHLSNPDGLVTMQINGKSYLMICEDLNGTSYGRVPAGITNRACELFMLDLAIENPTTEDLVRIAVSPFGSEITGACPTPDGKTLMVNAQHPSSANPFPYNYSLTFALTGWDLEQIVSVHELKKKNKAFKVYPNPSNGLVNLDKHANVAVYGADGKLIEVYENVIQFNLSEYPAGLYFIRNEEGATQRLLLN